MKKSLLSILPIVLLLSLSSCNANQGTTNNPEQGGTPDAGDTNPDQGGNTNPDQGGDTGPEQGGEGEGGDDYVDETYCKTYLTNPGFKGNLTAEPDEDGNVDTTQSQAFISWFNRTSNHPNLLASVNSYAVTNQKVKTKEFNSDVNYIVVGSQNHEGKLTFTFNKEISKVTFEVLSYYKYYSYTQHPEEIFVEGFNVDKNCKARILIDETEITRKDLPSKDNETPETVEISAEFATPTKSITIANSKGTNNDSAYRIMLNSIAVTWKN